MYNSREPRMKLRSVLVFLLAFFCTSIFARPARAGDYDQRIIPDKWIKPLLPEDNPEPDYADYDKNNLLEQARTQAWAGQYRRALVTLESVKRGDSTEIAQVRSECDFELGRYPAAITALSDPAVADDPTLQVLHARILDAQGDTHSAIDLLQKIISSQPDSVAARFFLGSYSEEVGDLQGALAAYQWFVTEPHNYLQQWQTNADSFNDAEAVTYIGRAVDRWATLTMAYQTDSRLHDTVLNMFVRSYDLIDSAYWPAHVAAANYFLLHDDPDQSLDELQSALDANPHDVSAWALVGKIAIDNFDFDTADHAVLEIRDVNPDSIEADLLEARNYMQQRVPKLALPALQRVLDRQPNNVEALGLMAGDDALLLKDDQTTAILKQVDTLVPNNALAYEEVADQLAAMRQYPRSAAMYQIAVQRAPWWSEARNGLGLLYTQSGDEDQARTVLEAAHVIDPYNVRTTNYLRLLDTMAKFARKESAHFIVIYDASQDPVVPEYFSDYLESIYPQVCSTFNYEPKVKTLIEVFPTHDEFSVRTTGAPWIATVGASTGRIIALVAPRAGPETMGTFNWSQVLHHEFTHTVTLGATDNRITHWFTEGLAVQQEHSPLRWEWVPMLYDAVTNHKLFQMDALTWAFIRPRKPIDRQLAYAQSYWICQYIEEQYGHAAILKMLDECRIGHSQDEMFVNALNRTQSQFFDEFQAWCEKQVATWGYDDATSMEYETLRDDGEDLIKRKQYAKAVPVFQDIAKIRPMDVLPHQRLAGLYMDPSVNQPEKAVEQLDILAAVELNDNRYAKAAARLYRDLGKLDLASQRALKAAYINPYDIGAHELLADIYQRMGTNPDGLAREKRIIDELNALRDAAETQPSQ